MTWVVGPNVVWLESTQETRLYDTRAGEFLTLNPTGSAVWRHLTACGDRDTTVACVAAEYGAQDEGEREAIGRDVDRFIRKIADLKLIAEHAMSDNPMTPG
jgi:hypothetical protein